jgi:hypothetical protein
MKSLTTLLLLVAFLIGCSKANYHIGQRGQEILRESTCVLATALDEIGRILH